jgi:cell wall-associated NlpC family hydrolase
MPRLWRRLVPLAALAAFVVACPGTASARSNTLHGTDLNAADGLTSRAAVAATLRAVTHRHAKVHARERRKAVRSRNARRAVHAALAQVGDAYAWGAGGPSAFDCSGLTRWALARAGVALPRSSFAQAQVGRPVRRDHVRRGDLVFFSTAGAGASHVGVAVSADVAVSATSHGVREHPISDAYWGAHYVGARRVVTG